MDLEEIQSCRTPLVTDLPIDIITQILDYLGRHDQYQASMSCRLFYDAFNHPYLWRTQDIQIYLDRRSGKPRDITEKCKYLATKFGKYAKHLTITIKGRFSNLNAWHAILRDMSKNCQLRTLILQIERKTPELYEQEFETLLSFIVHASKLKTLHIKAWPYYANIPDKVNIFKVLVQNPRMKYLESFQLFWPSLSEHKDFVMSDYTILSDVARHITNLQELGIRSVMLTKDLINGLTNSESINRLKILKIFADHDGFSIPRISNISMMWKQLIKYSPDVRVEYYVMHELHLHGGLNTFLSFNCPLSKIAFHPQPGQIDSDIIESVTNTFSTTLQAVEIYCEIKDIDKALLRMVRECTLLEHLFIKSTVWYCINYKTILKLAAMRGYNWKTFHFDEKNICFINKLEVDEDTAELLKSVGPVGLADKNLQGPTNMASLSAPMSD